MKCYDDNLSNDNVYDPVDPSYHDKAFNYFTLEAESIQNKLIPLNLQGVANDLT